MAGYFPKIMIKSEYLMSIHFIGIARVDEMPWDC